MNTSTPLPRPNIIIANYEPRGDFVVNHYQTQEFNQLSPTVILFKLTVPHLLTALVGGMDDEDIHIQEHTEGERYDTPIPVHTVPLNYPFRTLVLRFYRWWLNRSGRMKCVILTRNQQ